ncbi:MAG: serine O-acetyltransferase [Granulosicoccus sp.]
MDMTPRELIEADWNRLREISGQTPLPYTWKNAFSPRFASVYIMRRAQGACMANRHRIAKCWSLINFLVFNAEIPTTAIVGPGFVMPHPQGVILGAGVIGSNVTVLQQVTFGAKTLDFRFDPTQRPAVEDGVLVSAGAKIIGSVRLGQNCIVGANAVVVSDIPAKALAVGVPARVVEKDGVVEEA